MPEVTYDVVVATADRPEALAVSVPLLLSQTRPPARLIVIDASDDTTAVAEVLQQVAKGSSVEVVVEHGPRGLTRQRNQGLAYVTAPVVIFPDDDSLFYPDTAAELLTVYERDQAGEVSAVCAAEVASPPQEAMATLDYEMSAKHRSESRLKRLRHALECRLSVLKPALYLGRILNGRHDMPAWLSDLDAIPVNYMTGFRMSFRTEVIKATGFDEVLEGYCLDEDIDASFAAMRRGLVVGARRARINHHRFPGRRADEFSRGRMEVFNRAYVLLKHATGPIGSASLANAVWMRHRMFTALKVLSLIPKSLLSGDRARLAGVLAGHQQARQLWHIPVRDRPLVAVTPPVTRL